MGIILALISWAVFLPSEPMDVWIKLGVERKKNTNMIHMMAKCCKRHKIDAFGPKNVEDVDPGA